MKKLLIALLVLGLIAPGMAMAQNLDQRVTELENNMEEFAKQGMKLKETVIGMKKMGFHFGGSIKTHLGYYDVDKEYGAPLGGPLMDKTIRSNNGDGDSGTLLSLSAQSNITGRYIASENFYGVAQLGLRGGKNAGEYDTETVYQNKDFDDVYLRLAYGVWDFGNGKLTVGKDYTPATFLGYSNMSGDTGLGGDAIMLPGGLPYISRVPQIKLSFGDFDIALVEQRLNADDYGFGDVDFDVPRIEAAHVFRLNDNNLRIRPIAGFQTYDIEDNATGASESIDSYVFGVGVSADFGPAYVKGTVSYQQNPGNYGDYNLANVAFRSAVIDSSGSVNDADVMNGTLVAGYAMNDMVTFEGGVSYSKSEVDNPTITGTAFEASSGEQAGMMYYVHSWISMSDNLSVIPEFGVIDRDEVEYSGAPLLAGGPTVTSDLGSMTYFDVTLRVDF
ncbi:MAG: hypothetical protein K9K82_08920 [Desulfobacteraceae bacterium]|nr:hypothetical protein [Desulfobacteraceae bacterium]